MERQCLNQERKGEAIILLVWSDYYEFLSFDLREVSLSLSFFQIRVLCHKIHF